MERYVDIDWLKPSKVKGHSLWLSSIQRTRGSSYMKIYGWVIKAYLHGYRSVVVSVNPQHPHKDKLHEIAEELRAILHNLDLTIVIDLEV